MEPEAEYSAAESASSEPAHDELPIAVLDDDDPEEGGGISIDGIDDDSTDDDSTDGSTETGNLDAYTPAVASLAVRAADPAFEQVLLDVLDVELGDRAPDVGTEDRIQERLNDLFGPDGSLEVAFLVTTLGLRDEENQELQRILACVDDDVRGTVLSLSRRVRARYGPQLKRASTIAGKPPRDWSLLNAKVRRDLGRPTWEIELSIKRYDGEEFAFTGSPTAMVSLTSYILQQVNSLPSEEDEDTTISADMMEEFVTESDFLIQRFGEAEEPEDDVVPAALTNGAPPVVTV